MDKYELIRKGWVTKNETHLMIEFTDHCNFQCVMCNQSLNENNEPHFMKKGFMNFNLFKKIINDMKKSGVKFNGVSSSWAGESLLHPRFNGMLRYLFDANENNKLFRLFTINTNAMNLDKVTTDTILECASKKNMEKGTFNKITFSLDAINEETFKKIKQRTGLKIALNNIDYFINKQSELGIQDPKAIFQFIVMEENKHEAKGFLDYWSNYLKEKGYKFQVNYDWFPPLIEHTILFTKLNCQNPKKAEELHKKVVKQLGLITEKESKDRIIINDQQITKKEVRRPCPAPFKSFLVRWDGEVTTCCKDLALKHSIGNLNETSLKEAMNSEKLKDKRLAHIRGNLENYPSCQGCHNQPMPITTDEEIIEYLISVGEKKLIKPFLNRMKDKTKNTYFSKLLNLFKRL